MLEILDQDYFDSVKKFAESSGLAAQLQGRLDYLSDYGSVGLPDSPDRVENKCVLGKDFAPHSFSFAIYKPCESEPTGWRFWFQGGVIFQSREIPANGSSPSFTVSLAEGTGWFLHT